MGTRRLRVAMDEILDAMTMRETDPVRFFLDLDTGNVESTLTPELLESSDVEETELDRTLDEQPDRYEEIPRCEGDDEYRLMCRFAQSVDEDDIRAMLDLALQGRGAFSRFRDVVFRYPDRKAEWFALRQQVLLEEALCWLDSLGIEPEYELRRPVEHRPEPDSLRRPTITLLDMLLLGAPEGKTELLDGRVLRQVTARSPSEARAMFKDLARDLCVYFGTPWRKRFVQDTSTFSIERAHLRVDGVAVQLWIDVPKSVWEAFL